MCVDSQWTGKRTDQPANTHHSALLINPFYPKDQHASFGKHMLTPTLALTSFAATTPEHWTVNYWDALHPHSLPGAYINFMMDEGVDRIKATYRDNYARLAEVKRRYDPTNLFRVNQNIRSA